MDAALRLVQSGVRAHVTGLRPLNLDVLLFQLFVLLAAFAGSSSRGPTRLSWLELGNGQVEVLFHL